MEDENHIPVRDIKGGPVVYVFRREMLPAKYGWIEAIALRLVKEPEL